MDLVPTKSYKLRWCEYLYIALATRWTIINVVCICHLPSQLTHYSTANGWHVRFGPVDWDVVVDAAPKTTKVEGECFLNDAWTNCPEDFPFKDLWKAMRGGGGGYRVVLSSTIQLNPYRPLQWLRLLGGSDGLFFGFPFLSGAPDQCRNGLRLPPSTPRAPSPQFSALRDALFKFKYLSMLDPEKVGLNQTQSDACGTPGECSVREISHSYLFICTIG